MKSNWKSIRSLIAIGVVASIVTVLSLVSPARAGYVPLSQSNPEPLSFLNTSGTAQSKQSWLSLGTNSLANPIGVLDVAGTTIASYLKVVGNMWSTGKFRVGGNLVPGSSDPKLVVSNSYIRSSVLAGTGDRPVCADATGLFKLCDSPAQIIGTCGSVNATVQTSLTSTNSGLCQTGAPTAFAGSGPWTWTCSGSNGGASANCATVAAEATPPAPVMVFYSSIFSGGNSGAHDGIEWAPVIIPGTTTYAHKYEMQSFNPKKNFVDDYMDDYYQEFSPGDAAGNNWVTYGTIDYSTGGISGTTIIQTYNHWNSGNNPVWNVRLWDFLVGSGNQWNTLNNQHNDNGCYLGNSIAGCAYRVRAINGSTPGPWSNVIVLYDGGAPSNLSCLSNNATNAASHHYERGLQNFSGQMPCGYGNGAATTGALAANSVKFTWGISHRDNQNAPFLTYKVGAFCDASLSGVTVAILNQAAGTGSTLINGVAVNNAVTATPNCTGVESPNPPDPVTVYDYSYVVLPNRSYPAINYSPQPYPGSPMVQEEGFIHFY